MVLFKTIIFKTSTIHPHLVYGITCPTYSIFTPQIIPLPSIYRTIFSFNTQPVTRSQDGNFKPNHKYINLHTHVIKFRFPRNHVLVLKYPIWKMDIDENYNTLIENKMRDLVPRPPDVNIIWSMWIFRHKEKYEGYFKRHIARLVDDGAGEEVSMDSGETFILVVELTTIRMIPYLSLSIAWLIHQLEVKNSFLHSELKETNYMHQYLGWSQSISSFNSYVKVFIFAQAGSKSMIQTICRLCFLLGFFKESLTTLLIY